MTSRKCLLAAIGHEEPDKVPVCPRIWAWAMGRYGEEFNRSRIELYIRPGGGFILGSSDSFREDTPEENVRAYFRAARRYG